MDRPLLNEPAAPIGDFTSSSGSIDRVQNTDAEPALDTVNRPVWARRDVVADFTDVEGWSDPGERAAILQLAPQVRGKRVLDIGMGAGRTTTWMRLLTDAYVGVDITPEMIAAARVRHPGVDLRVADVRDLSAFPDGDFDLVMFSFNGIDAVGHADRELALMEIARVLRPGGSALISTSNKDSVGYGLTPWGRRNEGPLSAGVGHRPLSRVDRVEKLAHLGVRLLAHPGLPYRRFASWRKLRRESEDHGDWGIAPLDAYAFSLLVHWTTLRAACEEFAAVGLNVSAVFNSSDGSSIDPGLWQQPGAVASSFFHLLAQRV